MRHATIGGMGSGTGAGAWRAGPWLVSAALLLALASCRTPPPSGPPTGVADFDAPRPALAASLLTVSKARETRGDLQGALRAAEDARAAGPASAAAALRQAELEFAVAHRAGDAAGLEEARSAVEAIRRTWPEELAPRLVEGRLALADGQRTAAAEAARAVIEERPDWASAQVLLSEAVLPEDPAAALAAAERAVSLAPSDPTALAARARAYAALGNDALAARDARVALRQRPDPGLKELHVHSSLGLGRVRDAAEEAEGVLEADRTAGLERLLARARWILGDRQAALDAVGRSLQRAGADSEARDEGLALETEIAPPADALAKIQGARAVDPDDARLAELQARCELALSRPADATASARRAVDLAPDRPAAWDVLALAAEAGAAGSPETRARAALGTGADPSRVATLTGLLAERAGDRDAALLAYQAALAGNPDLAVAKLHLAAGLAAQGRDLERAQGLAESARRQIGWSRATAETLAAVALARGRPSDAVAPCRIALGALPPGAPGREERVLALAEALESSGGIDEARRLAASLLARAGRAGPGAPWYERAEALRKRLAEDEATPTSASLP
jgi:predicted Zn-dependent protease